MIPACKLTKPIGLNYSKSLIRFTTLGYSLAVIAIFNNSLSLSLKLFLLTALCVHYAYTAYTWKRWLTLKLYCHCDDWFISINDSKMPFYTVLGCSYWHPWLVILKVQNRSKKKSYLPILVDSCTQSGFKRLQLIAAKWLSFR